jgi:hypothetical protein
MKIEDKDICVVLTQYKRNHLEEQLEQIKKQTVQPKYLIVFQNGNHVSIEHLKDTYDFIHVRSDFNTKYFGRFSYCTNIPADIFLVFDDDMVPGTKCIENYVTQCISRNGIMGGNGRYGFYNSNKHTLKSTRLDTGLRPCVLVDFVGHLWCFKKEWLYYMFAVQPATQDTGEDMHLCFSAKLLGNIPSYICKHTTKEECSDIRWNTYACDEFSSYKFVTPDMRKAVEQYWLDKGLQLINKN